LHAATAAARRRQRCRRFRAFAFLDADSDAERFRWQYFLILLQPPLATLIQRLRPSPAPPFRLHAARAADFGAPGSSADCCAARLMLFFLCRRHYAVTLPDYFHADDDTFS
jgi:hypothetical protein